MFKSYSIFTLLFALLVFIACDPPEDNITPKDIPGSAPEFPPVEMYMLPISDFTQPGVDTTNSGKRVGGINSFKNWGTSALSLTALNAGILAQSAIPLAIFYQASVGEEAVELEDGSYEWTYQYVFQGKTYDIVLNGRYVALGQFPLQVEWRMFVSEQGGFQDFEWLSATVAILQESVFTIYKNPASPDPAINIAFGINDDTDGFNLRYMWAPLDNVSSLGAVLDFKTSPGAGRYDREFIFSPDDVSNPLEIQWNSITNEGRIRDEGSFGDYEWKCWNEKLRDEDC